MSNAVTWEGVHCTLTIRRPGPGVVVAVFEGGPDIGEFGDAPFAEMDKDLAPGLPIELFVDARAISGVSVDVSGVWSRWMSAHRNQLYRVNLLAGSRLLEVTAGFVRRFSGVERLRIYTDAAAFDRALAIAAGG